MAGTAAELVDRLRLPPAELARFLRLSAPAFDRALHGDRFTRDHRSRLLRLVLVLDRAQRVLGDRTRATDWLKASNRALGFSAPLALVDTKAGTERVYGVLSRIEDGRFA